MDTPLELEANLDRVFTEAEKLGLKNPAAAVRVCIDAIKKVSHFEDPPRSLSNQIARLKLLLSSLFIRLDAFDQALSFALSSHATYESIKLRSGVARSLNAIGVANMHLGTFAEALDNLLQSLELAEKLGDHRLKIKVFHNLGKLYLKMEDYSKALTYLQQGVKIADSQDQNKQNAELYVNICLAFLNLGRYSEALSHGHKAISLFENHVNNFGESDAFSTVGEVYAAMGHTFEALNYFKQSLELCQKFEYTKGIARAHYLIGNMMFNQRELQTSLEHLHLALDEAQKENYTSQIYRILHALYLIYREIGDYKNALIYFEKYHDTKEAVFNEDMATKIKSLEIMHEVRETQQNSEIYRLKNVELTREIEERKKVQAELERIVTLDPLTSLFNRRHFFELTQQELERSRRYNRPISIIMLDIDHFKQVNDRFGHLVGDRVIVEVARRIQKALRRIDLACRYGGEEFAILLPETNLHQAEMVATRLWQLVTRQPTVSGELKLKITVSVGVATYQLEGMITVDTLLDQADKAMYKAKQAGRNQVVVYRHDMNGNSG